MKQRCRLLSVKILMQQDTYRGYKKYYKRRCLFKILFYLKYRIHTEKCATHKCTGGWIFISKLPHVLHHAVQEMEHNPHLRSPFIYPSSHYHLWVTTILVYTPQILVLPVSVSGFCFSALYLWDSLSFCM